MLGMTDLTKGSRTKFLKDFSVICESYSLSERTDIRLVSRRTVVSQELGLLLTYEEYMKPSA